MLNSRASFSASSSLISLSRSVLSPASFVRPFIDLLNTLLKSVMIDTLLYLSCTLNLPSVSISSLSLTRASFLSTILRSISSILALVSSCTSLIICLLAAILFSRLTLASFSAAVSSSLRIAVDAGEYLLLVQI